MSEDARTGIRTDREEGAPDDPAGQPHGFRVTWIDWDSPWRQADLRIGDLVVGDLVVGDAVAGEAGPRTRYAPGDDEAAHRAVGQLHEPLHWREAGAGPGREVELTVLRGDEELTLRGALRQADPVYHDPAGRRALAPGGPDRLARDGFSGAWSGWYEDFVKEASLVLDGGWNRGSFDNRRRAADWQEHRPRVDHLREHFPGPFAEAVAADWQAVADRLAGEPVALTAADLEYREIGRRRAEQVAAEGRRAREALLAEVAGETMPTFPAPDPVEGGLAEAAGKLVDLPWITPRQFFNDLGSAYAAFGTPQQGFYFLDLESPAMRRFFDAVLRYQGQVDPGLAERYRFVARIEDDPALLTWDGRATTGALVRPVAGSAGRDDACFVDLRSAAAAPVGSDEAAPPRFAGEELLAGLLIPPLPPDARPEQVVATMIQAVKLGDRATWNELFATWRLFSRWSGPPLVDVAFDARDALGERAWTEARRRVTDLVFDARVAEVGRVRRLREADPETGAPRVDEVLVFIDHVGRFDGEYRTFVDTRVNRRWTLQRLDGGPWKITEPRSL